MNRATHTDVKCLVCKSVIPELHEKHAIPVVVMKVPIEASVCCIEHRNQAIKSLMESPYFDQNDKSILSGNSLPEGESGYASEGDENSDAATAEISADMFGDLDAQPSPDTEEIGISVVGRLKKLVSSNKHAFYSGSEVIKNLEMRGGYYGERVNSAILKQEQIADAMEIEEAIKTSLTKLLPKSDAKELALYYPGKFVEIWNASLQREKESRNYLHDSGLAVKQKHLEEFSKKRQKLNQELGKFIGALIFNTYSPSADKGYNTAELTYQISKVMRSVTEKYKKNGVSLLENLFSKK